VPHLQKEQTPTPPGVEDPFSMRALAREIGSLAHVKAILVEQDGDLFTVWTVVDDFSQSVRYRIYDAEARLIDKYHRAVSFDFNVIPGDESTTISRAVSIPLGR